MIFVRGNDVTDNEHQLLLSTKVSCKHWDHCRHQLVIVNLFTQRFIELLARTGRIVYPHLSRNITRGDVSVDVAIFRFHLAGISSILDVVNFFSSMVS